MTVIVECTTVLHIHTHTHTHEVILIGFNVGQLELIGPSSGGLVPTWDPVRITL